MSERQISVADGVWTTSRSRTPTAATRWPSWLTTVTRSLSTAMVREEARKAETVFTSYGVADVERTRETWVKNGGEAITLPPAEAALYLKDVTSVVPAIVAANPKMKEDYETLLAVAQKYRK